jgi:HlyD family secretion protein
VEVQVGEAVFERRAVDLGLSDGITVELLSGVTAEESIKVWNQPQYR